MRDLLLVFGLIGVIGFLFLKYFHRETAVRSRETAIATKELKMNTQIRCLTEQFNNDHSLLHNYRNMLFDFYFPYVEDWDVDLEEKTILMEVCRDVVNSVRSTLISYFKSKGIDIGEDVSVSIQLIVTDESTMEQSQAHHLVEEKKRLLQTQKYGIITIMRDSDTEAHRRDRQTLKRMYEIVENTAYRHVLIDVKNDFFVHNDLQSLADNNLYVNKNPNWKEQYNATLILPIRYIDFHSGRYLPFGLLSVDSLNKEGRSLYDSSETRHIVGHAADLLAIFFLVLALSKLRRKIENDESE